MNSKEYFEDLIALDKRVKIMRKTLQKLRESLDVKALIMNPLVRKPAANARIKWQKPLKR